MLTSALRSGGLSTTSVAEATPSRSPGVSSTAFRAQPPNLRFAPLMDMDFAVSCPLVRRWRLVFGFCPSTRTFVPCFLQTPPRGGSPCIITRPYLHQVGRRTFTSKLLSMPSTQRSRFAADGVACPKQARTRLGLYRLPAMHDRRGDVCIHPNAQPSLSPDPSPYTRPASGKSADPACGRTSAQNRTSGPESVPYYPRAHNRLRVPLTESIAGHLGIFSC